MERRDFIIKSGQVITVAMFINYFSTENLLAHPVEKGISEKRPLADNYNKAIYKAIALGINAASPYNIQAWKFKILSDTEMLLFIDENKLLLASDPLARETHIAAGCFIETLSIGISKYAYKANVSYFPEGYSTTDDFGIKAIAKITLSKQDKKIANPLSGFIYTRQTNRKHYKGDLITTIEFLDMKRLMGKTHSHLVFTNKVEEMNPYFDIFLKAGEIEKRTFSVSEEVRKMIRFSDDETEKTKDGISISQLGIGGFHKLVLVNSLKDGDKDAWHSEKVIAKFLKHEQNSIESSKGLIFIKTNSNKYMDWIKAGRDFTKFSLACASKEIQVQAINNITHDYDEMQALQKSFNEKVKLKSNEKIQMVLRIGRQKHTEYSFRKELNNFTNYD